MKCKYPDQKCPNMETQDNTCLLKNPLDCPMREQEQSLLVKVNPYRQALKAMGGVQNFGITSKVASILLSDLSDAFEKGVADAVMRLHQHYYKKGKMPQHLFEIMKEVYGEGGWFL